MAEPPAKRQRLDLSETIKIVVGKGAKAKEFTVHTSYATRSSPFIKAAMNPNWKEACEKRIKIPDQDPAAFEGYLNWIYSERVTLKENERLCENCAKGTPKNVYCAKYQALDLASMFILGDYLNDLRFCNAIVDDVKSYALKSLCLLNRDAIRCVWERTSPECQLRELYLQS